MEDHSEICVDTRDTDSSQEVTKTFKVENKGEKKARVTFEVQVVQSFDICDYEKDPFQPHLLHVPVSVGAGETVEIVVKQSKPESEKTPSKKIEGKEKEREKERDKKSTLKRGKH